MWSVSGYFIWVMTFDLWVFAFTPGSKMHSCYLVCACIGISIWMLYGLHLHLAEIWSQCQATSRRSLAHLTAFSSKCVRHAFTLASTRVFPYPDKRSRYRLHVNAKANPRRFYSFLVTFNAKNVMFSFSQIENVTSHFHLRKKNNDNSAWNSFILNFNLQHTGVKAVWTHSCMTWAALAQDLRASRTFLCL